MKKNPAAVALGRLGGEARARNLSKSALSKIGRKAGKARAARLTPAERSAIASKAAKARWLQKGKAK